ncbi:MAG: OsmC family protein [Acidimicrobiia bacterium]|nr:OsmC family protein [Acidimicrobiia bacterium]
MADERTVTSVSTVSTETKGRVINTARHNHFVIDSPTGPGEALSTGEAFLAGISACGVTLVQGVAAAEGTTIERLQVDISSVRLASNPVDFDSIEVNFVYRGVPQADAERLTETWKAR